tara:strand:- start:3680 stop:4474 length:795 start_codon:yes stop_codon:yes gene_type:complete
MGRGVIARNIGGDLDVDEAEPTSLEGLRSLRPAEAELVERQRLGALQNEFAKFGVRSPEDIKRIAEDRAKRRLAAVSKDDIPFSAQAASDFLAALGRAAVREEGNVGAAFVEETEKTKKKQAETRKLTKKQELANLEAEFKADDKAFAVPATLAKKKNEILQSNLSTREKILNLKKLKEEIRKLRQGDLGKFNPLVEKDKQEDTVKSDIEEVIKLSGNESLMTLFKGLDSETKNLMARLVAEERGRGTSYQKAIVKVLKEQLAK